MDVERRISGRFWISSPWLADERFEPSPTANLDVDLPSDLIRRLPSELSSISPEAAAAAASGSGSDDDEGMQEVAVSFGCDAVAGATRRLKLHGLHGRPAKAA